jgi:hypothetical protein
MSASFECACQRAGRVEHERALETFAALREKCPVLRLLVPDDLWPTFAAWHQQDEVAWHRSISLLALERGHLKAFTSPLHRVLIDGGALRPGLRAQYLQDLRERWMLADDPRERHRKSRMFTGRFVELHLAAWLEAEGWNVTGLEAYRSGPDIEGVQDAILHAFEVKSIGAQDEAFESIVDSLHNLPALRWTSPDAAANYLLFRAYEAGWQLRSTGACRVAVLAIDGLCWHDFEIQLEESWIDWSGPQFLGEDKAWQTFLASQEERYPSMLGDLPQVVTSLDAIWVFRRLEGFSFQREFMFKPKAVASI